MLIRRTAIVCFVFALAAGATGCGSDEKNESASKSDGSTQTRSAEDARSDDTTDADAGVQTEAYRVGLEAAGGRLEAAGGTVEASTDWASYSSGLRQLRGAVQAFEVLTPPDDVAAEHDAMIASLRAAVAHAAKITQNSTDAADTKSMAAAMAELGKADASAESIFEQLDA